MLLLEDSLAAQCEDGVSGAEAGGSEASLETSAPLKPLTLLSENQAPAFSTVVFQAFAELLAPNAPGGRAKWGGSASWLRQLVTCHAGVLADAHKLALSLSSAIPAPQSRPRAHRAGE